MKAALLIAKRKFDIIELPEPTVPNDGLILQVEACGICGSDLRRWDEGPSPDATGDVNPGHEVAGVVIAVGPQTTEYAVGDRLALAPDVHCGRCYYCAHGRYNLCDHLQMIGITPGYPGGLADKMALNRNILTHGIVHRLPEGMPFTIGALAEPCSSVLAVHQKVGTSVKDTVVVLGAGPIGCLHVAIAKAQGARVIVSQRSARRRELVRAFGPDEVIDPAHEDPIERVRALTGGLGADLVICANGVAEAQAQAVEMARKGGRVILFGGLPKAAPLTTINANRVHYGEIEVMGAFSYHPTFHALALEVLARGLIPTDILISHTFRLQEIDCAFEAAASRDGLKVMVIP